MMEQLAIALEPYAELPPEAVVSVILFVLVAGSAIIFAATEIMARGRWNQEFQERTALRLDHMLRSHARRGRRERRHTVRTRA